MPKLREPLQHNARHDIKNFQRVLLSLRPIGTSTKAYRAADLDDRVACVEQLSNAELMRIAMGDRTAETATQRRKGADDAFVTAYQTPSWTSG